MQWREAKRSNKVKVAAFIREKAGYSVSPDAMFDIQVRCFFRLALDWAVSFKNRVKIEKCCNGLTLVIGHWSYIVIIVIWFTIKAGY